MAMDRKNVVTNVFRRRFSYSVYVRIRSQITANFSKARKNGVFDRGEYIKKRMSKPKWACSQCTYDNFHFVKKCEMCNHPNESSKDKPTDISSSTSKEPYVKRRTAVSPIVIDLSDTTMNNCASMESARRKKRRMQDCSSSNDVQTNNRSKGLPQLQIEFGPKSKNITSDPPRTTSISHLTSKTKQQENYGESVLKISKSIADQYQNKEKSKENGSSNKKQRTLFGNIVKNIQQTNIDDIPDKMNHATINEKQKSNSNLRAQSESSLPIKQLNVIKKEETQTSVRPMNTNFPENNKSNYDKLFQKSQEVMKSMFKIPNLRNLQPQAIEHAFKGQSQIIVMATGGGKSLCYQLPAGIEYQNDFPQNFYIFM